MAETHIVVSAKGRNTVRPAALIYIEAASAGRPARGKIADDLSPDRTTGLFEIAIDEIPDCHIRYCQGRHCTIGCTQRVRNHHRIPAHAIQLAVPDRECRSPGAGDVSAVRDRRAIKQPTIAQRLNPRCSH